MAVSISLSVTQNSQSVANNTSNVTVKVNYSWTSGSWNTESSTKYVKINGTKYSFNGADINPNRTTSGSGTLYTKTLDIKHNSDGTKKLEVSAYVDTDISSGVLTKSTTKTLTTIPRASTVTATAAVVGSASTITISRKSSSFTHTLEYTFGSLSGTITTKTTSTSVKWTLPTTFYAQIGSTATSKSGTITCKTYSGSTLVGTKTCSFTAKTSSSTCAPTLSPTITPGADTQALTGNTTTLIKGWSSASVTFGASARNSATLSSKKCTNSGKSRTTDGSFTDVTDGKFVFTATDSRGYSTSVTKTLTLINYVKLTCSFKANLTVDGTGTLRIYGDYFNGSFGATSNTLTVQYRYKQSGGSYTAWTTITATKSGNTYTATKSLSGFDYQKTYTFQARATDKATGTVTTSAKNVKALPVFDWGEDDFNHNTSVRIPNNKALSGWHADGTSRSNICYVSPDNNVIIGGGSYPPQSIYFNAAEGGNVLAGRDGEDYISVLGGLKALCNSYTLDCTVTKGKNYTDASASAILVGNNLRVYMKATRQSAFTAADGNTTNETVMTIDVKHNGKIDVLYRVDFNSGITGGAATFSASTAEVDSNTYRITITLCDVTSLSSEWTAYFAMPANLKLSAYI